MATRALQQVVIYMAWDTVANAYKTGDSANHTTSWVKDGTRSATTNATAEVDATNVPGAYKVTMTATETDCIEGVLGGKSSTSNIVLIPTMVAFDYLNTSAPTTAGIPDVNAKNIGNTAQTGRDIGASVLLASGQKVDVDTIKTNPVVNAGTVTFPASATLASTTNITAGTLTTVTTATNLTTNNDKTGYALTAGERTSVADALLDRDMSTGADSGSTTVRTVRNALRFLRNKWSISGTTLSVCKEDDTTTAWTSTLATTAGANPVTTSDPAG